MIPRPLYSDRPSVASRTGGGRRARRRSRTAAPALAVLAALVALLGPSPRPAGALGSVAPFTDWEAPPAPPGGYTHLEQGVFVESVPPAGGWFVETGFTFVGDPDAEGRAAFGYLGLQTGCDDSGGNGCVWRRQFLFSLWGGRGAVAPQDGRQRVVRQSGDEGAESSITLFYDWQPGHYYRYKMEPAPVPSPAPERCTATEPCEAWNAYLADLGTDPDAAPDWILAGTSMVPAQRQGLQAGIQNFVENYLGGYRSCAEQPPAGVQVEPPALSSPATGTVRPTGPRSGPSYLSKEGCLTQRPTTSDARYAGGQWMRTPMSPAVDYDGVEGDDRRPHAGAVQRTGTGTVTTPGITTTRPGDLLVAYVAAGSADAAVSLSAPGLTWSRAVQNRASGTDVEVWTARAPSPLADVPVTSAMAATATTQQLTVYAFTNAAGLGATGRASGLSGPPSVALTATRSGSAVFAVGAATGPGWPQNGEVGPYQHSEFPAYYGAPDHPDTGATAWLQRADELATGGRTYTLDATGPWTAAWNLAAVEVVPQSVTVSATVAATGTGTVTAPTLTPPPGDLLVATVATSDDVTDARVTGGGLTWRRALHLRSTATHGYLDVFTARAPSVPRPITVSSPASPQAQSLTVQSFSGAGGIGATATAETTAPRPSAVTLTPQATGSIVSGVGYDWYDRKARVAGAGQVIDQQALDPTQNTAMWVQHALTPTVAGQPVTLDDPAPTADNWTMAAFEVEPA